MTTWKELLENEKGNAELWIGRVATAYQQERGLFTYRELGDLWGVDKQGAWVKLDVWARDYPDLVRLEKESVPHKVHLAFSEADAWLGVVSEETAILPETTAEIEKLAESTVIDYPLFVGQRAYEQTIERLDGLGILEADNRLEFERLGWDSRAQRGGLTITILDGKLPMLVAVGRFDNGFLISPLKISTPKLV